MLKTCPAQILIQVASNLFDSCITILRVIQSSTVSGVRILLETAASVDSTLHQVLHCRVP